jgi:hypothetical protein
LNGIRRLLILGLVLVCEWMFDVDIDGHDLQEVDSPPDGK